MDLQPWFSCNHYCATPSLCPRELGVWPRLLEVVLSMDTTMSSAERAPSFLDPDIATGALI